MSKNNIELKAAFHRVGRNVFGGWVYDKPNTTERLAVELLVDGLAVAAAISDEFVQRLFEEKVGDGRFGFSFSLPDEVVRGAAVVEARLANLNTPIGSPIDLSEADKTPGDAPQIGELTWVGGLRFEGWLDPSCKEVSVFVSEQLVTRLVPNAWTHRSRAEGYQAVRRVDLHLPSHFADGRVRLLAATSSGGRSLTPVPVPFVAFDNGLEQTLGQLGRWDSERPRGKLFDQLIPSSLPFYRYDEWKERFRPEQQEQAPTEAAVIAVGEQRISETVESLEAEEYVAWTAISLPTTGFCTIDNAAAVNFVEGDAASCDFIVFCPAGSVFASDALSRFAQAFHANPECRCIYADLDIQAQGGGVWPLAFSAFDRERALEQGYGALLFAMRRDDAADALRTATSLYELFNAAFIEHEAGCILHLPGAVASLPPIDLARAGRELADATRAVLKQQGIRARIEVRTDAAWPAVRVRREIPNRERTTIIVPTRNRVELLRRCIETIMPAVRKERAEILIVDNDSSDPETLDYLETAASEYMRVLSISGSFNFSRLNNLAVEECRSDNICLVNNDIEAIDDDWLGEMLSRLADPGVGAVGAKLLWPSRVVQHGGVVLGVNFAATHAFNDRMDGDPGYGGLLQVAHECSAVTAACLLLRRRDYLSVGGLDELFFPINFNDVDLCLKLREQGYRIVFAPDAKLLHLESASRGRDQAPDRKARFDRELMMLRAKWGDTLLDDPYYNPILGLDSTPYSTLAWPPRSFSARANRMRPATPIPPLA
ncbi:glycosyltransferase family 2 protein [Bradyrhizobium guangzhouense]|uniref:glycosyltransferase family 2 protein n=1 Tax=Bradyrhizobium guangzhouense TaxID=1325095 RepID=UPI0010098DBF|nr:glycosyltransferase family 2 protein [Bradyrhizobium guangzhouense]RXH10107.1 glycosyltransferase family 2 protein [Bradyrhizobium guangzhouense]